MGINYQMPGSEDPMMSDIDRGYVLMEFMV